VYANSRPKRILAIDWDPRTLRIVEAKLSKRSFVVQKVLSAQLPADVDVASPESLGAFIRATLEKERIATRHAMVDIPRDQAVLNTLKLPCTAPDELPSIVQLQIAKELPFPLAEATVDFSMPPTEPGQTTADILVAAVRREVVDHYIRTCEEAGLKLDRIGLRPHANKLAVCRYFAEQPPQRVVFIDVGPVLTEIDVIRDGRLAFSRAASVPVPSSFESSSPRLSLIAAIEADEDAPGESINLGDPHRPEGRAGVFGVDAVVNGLMLELTRSLEAYRAHDHGAQIDKIVVGGDIGCEAELVSAVRSRLKLDAVQYSAEAVLGNAEQGAAAAAYAATMGLLIGMAGETARSFDFLHPKQTVTAAKKRLMRAPRVAAVFVLFVTASVVGAVQFTSEDRARRAQLQKAIAELDEGRTDKDAFLRVVKTIRDFDRESPVWVDVMYDLVSALPSNRELVVESIDMDQNAASIVVKTRTKELTTAHKAVEELNKFRREGFAGQRFKARIRNSSSPDDREEYPYRQDLAVQILADAPAKARVEEESK
jgi:type IV pilus assembly protein PilM